MVLLSDILVHRIFFSLYTAARNRLRVHANCYRQITAGHATSDSPESCSTSKRLSAVTRLSPAVSTRRLCRSRSSFFHMTVFSPTSRTTHVMSASSPSYTCTGRGRVSLMLGTPAETRRHSGSRTSNRLENDTSLYRTINSFDKGDITLRKKDRNKGFWRKRSEKYIWTYKRQNVILDSKI